MYQCSVRMRRTMLHDRLRCIDLLAQTSVTGDSLGWTDLRIYSYVCFMSTALWWQWIQALSLKAAQKYAREFTVNCTALILDCFVSAKRIRTQTAI